MTSIDKTLRLARDSIGLTDTEYQMLRSLLVSREDNIADHIRLAARQFNARAEIVAEVLAQTGLGSPLTKEERDYVRKNFDALMEQRGHLP